MLFGNPIIGFNPNICSPGMASVSAFCGLTSQMAKYIPLTCVVSIPEHSGKFRPHISLIFFWAHQDIGIWGGAYLNITNTIKLFVIPSTSHPSPTRFFATTWCCGVTAHDRHPLADPDKLPLKTELLYFVPLGAGGPFHCPPKS